MISFATVVAGVFWMVSSMKVRVDILERDLKEIKEALKVVGQHVIESLVSAGKLQGLEERLNLLIRRVDLVYDKTTQTFSRTTES
jgi:hypothetical protein